LIPLTDLSLHWPEIVRFRRRVEERFRPKAPDCILLLPCSRRKPYSASKSHRLFSRVTSGRRRRMRIQEIVVTSPLGAVPRQLEAVPPARNYDIPVTGIWSEDELEVVSTSLARVISNCSEDQLPVLAHVTGGYREACRRAEEILGWRFEYTSPEPPTSDASLKVLNQALSRIEGGGRRMSEIEQVREVLAYQYGREAAKRITAQPASVKSERGYRRIVCGDRDVARENPSTGLFTPEEEGARVLSELGLYCVDVDFDLKTKVLYSPGVVSADHSIRPGDEVVVRRGGRPVGEGTAVLCGREMERSGRGKAVVLRRIFRAL